SSRAVRPGARSAPRALLLSEAEINLGDRALSLVRDLPEFRGHRLCPRYDEVRGELLLLGVVARGGVVIHLPRERDLVFRGREFFLQLSHVARRLELRVRL